MQIARKIAEDAGVGRPKEEVQQPVQPEPPQNLPAAGSGRDSSLSPAGNTQAGVAKQAEFKQPEKAAEDSRERPAIARRDRAKAKEDGSQKQAKLNPKSKPKQPDEAAEGSKEISAAAAQNTGKAKENNSTTGLKTELKKPGEDSVIGKRTDVEDSAFAESHDAKGGGSAVQQEEEFKASQTGAVGHKDADREFPSPESAVEVVPHADSMLQNQWHIVQDIHRQPAITYPTEWTPDSAIQNIIHRISLCVLRLKNAVEYHCQIEV